MVIRLRVLLSFTCGSFVYNKYKLSSFSDRLKMVLANVHSYLLDICGQIPFAGVPEEEIEYNTPVKMNDKKSGGTKLQSVRLLNRPYSKCILAENIR